MNENKTSEEFEIFYYDNGKLTYLENKTFKTAREALIYVANNFIAGNEVLNYPVGIKHLPTGNVISVNNGL